MTGIDRRKLKFKPLAARENKVVAERDFICPGSSFQRLDEDKARLVSEAAERIRAARDGGCPVMMTFGAHTIKNGLGPVISSLAAQGWLTHLATNGAGIIHDWEFAYQGRSSEDVRAGVARGEFGNWRETGWWLNMALNVGAFRGLGYGESVGALIAGDGLELPGRDELAAAVVGWEDDPERSAAAADLLAVTLRLEIDEGWHGLEHAGRQYSLQAAALEHGVPLTGHPMFGHDIIYNHPANCGAAIGRCAERDFLSFAAEVSNIAGGVYLSVGSAVMSPMVFEKSMSMAQNLALQRGERIEDHYILVVDLAESKWDWSRGEPPEDNPDYYLRYNKSFSRMGGTMRYLSADNRDFLPALHAELTTGNRD
ncbi:MAG: hypothetical protein FVQ81_15350 [Candidatus Glassbacteria bacterium]|nr:hypothetical protein [Candidatus Glassbacteria bacterium]